MQRIEFNTDRFTSTDEQASQTKRWQARYVGLVAKLGELGSEVSAKRAIESDEDIAPYRFIRGAVHEFVFPPQQLGEVTDNSRVIDSSPGYGITREDFTYVYDEAQVRGHLRVTYDDANSMISLGVDDIHEGGSELLPGDVLAELAQAVALSTSSAS